MRHAYTVATVRAAEQALMAQVPEGVLMQRAAAGLARTCALLLREQRGRVTGSRVVVLAGSGNNGGDGLWAGAALAARGARVDAVLLSEGAHAEGLAALRRAGGRVWDGKRLRDGAPVEVGPVLLGADLIMDGIVGIGGSGGLRPAAAVLAAYALRSGAVRVAVDVPSGVDADTGQVSGASFDADVTVTFGCLKPGLLLPPGRALVGAVEVVDIGLGPYLSAAAEISVLDPIQVACAFPEPQASDHKYTRGVVGVLAGSARYRGAALLCVGSARRGGAGMVRYVDRGDAVAAAVVDRWPDVVVAEPGEVLPALAAAESAARRGTADGHSGVGDGPGGTADSGGGSGGSTVSGSGGSAVTAWVAGPGMGSSPADAAILTRLMAVPEPVVIDADGLRLVAEDPQVRAAVADRVRTGAVTVLTPHPGEFARLGYETSGGRAAAARQAAADLGCVVVLKGSGTVVAAPTGPTWIDTIAPPALATAGSGDVLAGLLGSVLARHAAGSRSSDGGDGGDGHPLDTATAARLAAATVQVHALAALAAQAQRRPVAALDVLEALPTAVATARRSG